MVSHNSKYKFFRAQLIMINTCQKHVFGLHVHGYDIFIGQILVLQDIKQTVTCNQVSTKHFRM